MKINITYSDYKLLKLILNTELKYETIKKSLNLNICKGEENIILEFHSKLDVFKFRNDIIKFIRHSNITRAANSKYTNILNDILNFVRYGVMRTLISEYINILKKINSQYKILDILVLEKKEYLLLVNIYEISYFDIKEEDGLFYFHIESNNLQYVIDDVEEKVSDYLQIHGIDPGDEVNSVGIICENIIDAMYDQLI